MKNILYFISLILFIASLVILVEFYDSQRLQGIAGVFFVLGMTFNLVAYFLRGRRRG